MYKKAEVGPYLVNIPELVMLNHHFHTHLAPCRYTNNVTDIPLTRMLYNLIELLVPIAERCDPSTGLIKSLEPERTFFCQDTTQVASIPSGLSFFKIGCATQHKKAFCHGFLV